MTLTGSIRFARYGLGLWRRTWYGDAFTVFVAPILYLAGIGLGVGALVDGGGATAELGGVSYAAFAGTGLLAASSMTTAVGQQSWPVIGAIRYTGTWVAITSTPLSSADVVGGNLLLLAGRLIVASAIFGVSLGVLGLVDLAGAVAVVAPGVLVGLAWGMPMFAFTAWIKEIQGIGYFFRFVVVPSFILSGTFFPIGELPAVVQPVAVFLPLWHGVELVRWAGLGHPTAYPVAVHVVVLALCVIIGTGLTVRHLTKRLQP